MSTLHKPAFTLIELLVSLAIMVVILGLFLANYKGRERGSELAIEAQKLLTVLKQAQMMALTGQLQDAERPFGYGVNIASNTSYILFADMDDSKTKNTGDKDVETVNLSSSLRIDQAGSNIVFSLPEARSYLNGVDKGEITLTLTHQAISKTKEITVQAETGKVDIE